MPRRLFTVRCPSPRAASSLRNLTKSVLVSSGQLWSALVSSGQLGHGRVGQFVQAFGQAGESLSVLSQ